MQSSSDVEILVCCKNKPEVLEQVNKFYPHIFTIMCPDCGYSIPAFIEDAFQIGVERWNCDVRGKWIDSEKTVREVLDQ